MTYLTQDGSVQASRPVELYAITNTLGVVTRYTSHQVDFTFDGFTWTAKPGLKRGQFAIMSSADVPEMTVEMPVSDSVVAAYCGVGVPPQRWTVAITSVQADTGDSKPIHQGYVSECAMSGHVAVFRVAQLTGDALEQPIPSLLASRLCPHVLYDAQCGVDRNANDVATTITIDTGNTRLLTVASIGAFGAHDFILGELLHAASGERRTIVGHDTLDIEIDVPLPTTAANGDSVTIFRGCARTVEECRVKFNNVLNFGGAPHMVTTNPWFSQMNRTGGS